MPDDSQSNPNPNPTADGSSSTSPDSPQGSAPTSSQAANQPSSPSSTQASGASSVTTPAAQAAVEAKAPTWLIMMREGTTTLIALVITAVTVYMLIETFIVGASFDKMKDVLLLALPLLGTILGYYFGRVPAERRAEASEQKAASAQETAQAATTQATQTEQRTSEKMNQVKVAVERAKAKLEGGASPSSSPSGGPQTRGGVLGGPSIAGASGDDAPSAKSSGTTEAWTELDAVSKML